MNKVIVSLSILTLSCTLTSCSNELKETSQNKVVKENKDNNNQTSSSSNSSSEIQKENTYLEGFSKEEIEYARIWYQLRTSNYNVDTNIPLYVKNIRRGSKVNPQAENSAVYKEDVTTISSSHRAIGSITYSSNGDGTINLYEKVPYKWESPKVSDYSNMEEVTKSVIEEDVETIYVDPSDNQHVKNIAGNIKYTN